MKKSVAGTAADPTIQYTTMKIGGEEYKLAFDFNNIAQAETETGVNLLSTFTLNGMNAGQLRGALLACLRKAHPNMTADQAGALITLQTMPLISEKLVEAWTGSMPKPDPNAEAPADPAQS